MIEVESPMESIIDISRPLYNGMPVWPGDAPFMTTWTGRIAGGDTGNVGSMSLSLHSGTHLDAASHTLASARPIAATGEQAPDDLNPFIGCAQVIHMMGASVVTADALRKIVAPGILRVLLRTDSFPIGEFTSAFTWIESNAAKLLAELGVSLIGIDTPSVDAFQSERLETHKVLATAGIYILEGLDLSRVDAGLYELVALPLRLCGMDASPVRAVLRRVNADSH